MSAYFNCFFLMSQFLSSSLLSTFFSEWKCIWITFFLYKTQIEIKKGLQTTQSLKIWLNVAVLGKSELHRRVASSSLEAISLSIVANEYSRLSLSLSRPRLLRNLQVLLERKAEKLMYQLRSFWESNVCTRWVQYSLSPLHFCPVYRSWRRSPVAVVRLQPRLDL